MTDIATVCVQILGKEYPVACPAGQEHELEAAAQFVDSKMCEIQEKTGTNALERLAVMAALNIAHEYINNKPEADEKLSQLADQISSTLRRLSETDTG